MTTRALGAWAGTPHLTRREPPPASAAGAILDLFVAGRTVERRLLRVSEGALAELAELGLIEVGDRVLPRAAILPLGEGYVVCDRATWPDDSSYHLAGSLPVDPIGRWIDLGCGSAFAAIARPRLAREAAGVELVPATARFATLGAQLSRRSFAVTVGDLAIDHPWRGTCDLVSCNMPIPDGGTASAWHSTDAAMFDRLWPAARALLAPGGLVVIHSALAPVDAAELPGERVTIAYTPRDAAVGFGVTWWRPDGPPGDHRATRLLTAARPHLDARDREDVPGT